MSQKYIGGFITKSPVAPTGPYDTSVASGMWTIDQAMQLKKQGLWPTAGNVAIGSAYGGGYFAGQIGVGGVATHNIVIGPVSSAEYQGIAYKNVNTATTGADSVIDGPQNTADIVADGNATVYPAGHFCNDLTVGGFTDWYMPAKNELEICYFNLKPKTTSNSTGAGTNTNAVPSRASNYTAGTPAQTSAVVFQDTNAEQFGLYGSPRYWSSTEFSATYAWRQDFNNGYQGGNAKNTASYNVRAIRRVAV
jgi:hypothetical protein